MQTFSYFLDAGHLKAAHLKMKGQEVEILLLRSFSKERLSSDVKQLYMESSGTSEKSLLTVGGLETSEVLLRHLTLPLTNPLKIRAALPFQLESILPYPPEEAIVVPISEKRSGKQTSLSFFAINKSQISPHLEKATSFSLAPDVISCAPAALHAWAQFAYPETSSLALLEFGRGKSTLVCLRENELQLSLSLPVGVEDLLLALGRDLPHLSKEEIEEAAKDINLCQKNENFPHLYQQVDHVQKELERTVAYLQQKTSLSSGFPLALSGEIFSLFKLERLLKESLSAAFTLLDPPQHALFAPASLQTYAIPLGLSLNALGLHGQSVQFLQGNAAPGSYAKKKLKPLFAYSALCLFLALGTALIGSFWTHKREAFLCEQLLTFREKTSGQSGSRALLEEELDSWEHTLKEQKRPFPFDPSVPKVSDTLAFLSTHPLLTLSKNKEGIEIKQLRYQLVKHPKVGRPNEPYEAKVELEFTATSPKLAQAFRESLQKGDQIVNSKADITWTAKDQLYRTSFYLKKQGGP